MGDVKVHFLDSKDRYLIKDLYMEAFDDKEAFVDYYINDFNGMTAVLEIDGAVVSMVNIHKKKLVYKGVTTEAAYIYGVATRENARKKGYMSRLMKFVLENIENDFELIFLIPAVDVNVYRGLGFELVRGNKLVNIYRDEISMTNSNIIDLQNYSDMQNYKEIDRPVYEIDNLKMYINDLLELDNTDYVRINVRPIMVYKGKENILNSDIVLNNQIIEEITIENILLDKIFEGFIYNEEV